ncbi:DUF3082 domain-containing protein [Prochlorococcus sp. MIT 1223]|uniref:DUF3082 domain-containing protein n=1 Tax=Prochlorococcus sp. MIT 1223 TaxID=3096217 RepID=UPI002A75DB25|nr:DUF3082 domain-containing protein [Prochlorococcus sp. MIT 1223]
MKESKDLFKSTDQEPLVNENDSSADIDKENSPLPEKGPINFLSGAVTSLLFAWISLIISKKVVIYFALHQINYSSAIAQSIASGFKTLITGMCFLATFTFGFIGLGLTIVFIRSLLPGNQANP